jgi:hypothetical protein
VTAVSAIRRKALRHLGAVDRTLVLEDNDDETPTISVGIRVQASPT